MNKLGKMSDAVIGITDDTETCGACGETGAEFWIAGDWYCLECAACEICGNPHCINPEHE